MTCEAYASHIRANLEKLPNVRSATVNFAGKSARIVVGRENIDDEAIQTAVESAGYKVVQIRTRMNRTSLDAVARTLADGLRESLCSNRPQLFVQLLRLLAEGCPVFPEQLVTKADRLISPVTI